MSRYVRRTLTVLSVVVLGLWAAWWVESVRRDTLAFGGSTWVPALPSLAGDFRLHLDHIARLSASGVNPYFYRDDFACSVYPYPPMVPRLFAWVNLATPEAAVKIWLAALAAMIAGGAVVALRVRRELRLGRVPPALGVAAVLFSTPAVLAMERGQCDPLAVPALAVMAWLLRRRSAWADPAAGALLGLTVWLKYYPGAAAVGLLALGRYRALAAFVAVAGVVGFVDRAEIRQSIDNGKTAAVLFGDKVPVCHPTKHGIVEGWPALWFRTRLRKLRAVPGPLAAAALLIPAAAVVCRKVGKAADPGPLVLPLFLWLTAATTYAMPWSNDYNLVLLPLAALAVWDHRDPKAVHVCLALSVVWCQPLALPWAGGKLLFVLKLAALYAVGASLVVKARGTADKDPWFVHAAESSALDRRVPGGIERISRGDRPCAV